MSTSVKPDYGLKVFEAGNLAITPFGVGRVVGEVWMNVSNKWYVPLKFPDQTRNVNIICAYALSDQMRIGTTIQLQFGWTLVCLDFKVKRWTDDAFSLLAKVYNYDSGEVDICEWDGQVWSFCPNKYWDGEVHPSVLDSLKSL